MMTDPKKKKKEDHSSLAAAKKRFPGRTVTPRKAKKKQPSWGKKSGDSYTVSGKDGGSFSYTPGKKGSGSKKYTVAEALNAEQKKKNKK